MHSSNTQSPNRRGNPDDRRPIRHNPRLRHHRPGRRDHRRLETTDPLTETGKEAGQRAGQLLERGTEIGLKQADRGLDAARQRCSRPWQPPSVCRVSADMETDQPQIADFASTAADQAEALAAYLRETDVRQMIDNVENFARRQPLLFVGGAFLLGMVTSRFIKAAGGDQGQGRAAGLGSHASSGDGFPSAKYAKPPAAARAATTGLRPARAPKGSSEMQEPEDSRSIGTLLGDLGRQVSTLVRKEIDLARVEITSSLDG